MSKRQRDGLDAPAKKAAKNRFKKLVRTVILNMQWLNEATEETGISLNVKKNVAMLVRQKRKVGMMTMAVSTDTLYMGHVHLQNFILYKLQEKSLLRTPHSTRTVEDNHLFLRKMAKIKNFQVRMPLDWKLNYELNEV